MPDKAATPRYSKKRIATPLWECNVCGAVVADTWRHNVWHHAYSLNGELVP